MILMEDCNDGWDGSFSSKHHFFFINYLLLLLNCFLTIAENLSRVKWCRLLKIHNNNNSASAHHATFQNYVEQAECINQWSKGNAKILWENVHWSLNEFLDVMDPIKVDCVFQEELNEACKVHLWLVIRTTNISDAMQKC